MTEQSSDYVLYKHKRYNLIDCESNLIKTADFGMKETNCHSTACYRGYTAEYSIEDNILYGTKSVDYHVSEDSFDSYTVESEKMRMHYTGAILIAFTDTEDFNYDFLETFLDAEEAYELYFVDGILKKEIALESVIKGWDRLVNDNSRIYRKLNCEKYLKRHLKYRYCDYKWKTRG